MIPRMINDVEVRAIEIINESAVDGNSAGSSFASKQLNSVVFPDTLRIVGENAFRNNQLTYLELNDGLLRIHHGAFAENKLSSVNIPRSVTHIASYVFNRNNFPLEKGFILARNADGSEDTSHLVSFASHRALAGQIVDLSRFHEIDKSVFSEEGLAGVQLSPNLKRINSMTFYGNTLNFVDLPDGLESIGPSAFMNNARSPVIGYRENVAQ